MPSHHLPHLQEDHLGRMRPARRAGQGLRPRRPVVPRPPEGRAPRWLAEPVLRPLTTSPPSRHHRATFCTVRSQQARNENEPVLQLRSQPDSLRSQTAQNAAEACVSRQARPELAAVKFDRLVVRWRHVVVAGRRDRSRRRQWLRQRVRAFPVARRPGMSAPNAAGAAIEVTAPTTSATVKASPGRSGTPCLRRPDGQQ